MERSDSKQTSKLMLDDENDGNDNDNTNKES
jgi:hypothetical protein